MIQNCSQKCVRNSFFNRYGCWVVFVYPKRSQNGPKIVPKWHQIGHRGLSWRLLGSSWALPGACWRPSRPKECPKGPQEAPEGIPETILDLIWGHILKPKAFKNVRFVCTMVPCAKRLNLFGILLAANNCCPRNGSPWRVLGRSPGVKKQCFGCIVWQRFGVQTRAQTTSKIRKT